MNRNTNITKYMLLVCMLLAVSGCRDDFDLDDISNKEKLVVYCLPSTTGTTYISVTNSMAIGKHAEANKMRAVADAQVSYRVNGETKEVGQKADGTFYTDTPHHAGDCVELTVTHPRYGTATASAVVPESIPVRLDRVQKVSLFDEDYMSTRDYYQLAATFTDPVESKDYYAVTVRAKHYKGDAYGELVNENGSRTLWIPNDYNDYLYWKEQYPQAEWTCEISDSVVETKTIYTAKEPLLNTLTDIDTDFGYENSFYGNFYIFNDATINGQTYTLHLYTDSFGYGGAFNFWHKYQVVLYRLTPEYYHFLKSLNDVENNDLAQAGFSLVSPTLHNISGGFGLLGASNSSESEWMALDNE